MDQEKINALGDELYEALCGAYALLPLTDREPDIQIEDAYQISLRLLQRRMEDRGETIVGKKIGVTSQPVQEMLGVFQPDFGFLTNTMEYQNSMFKQENNLKENQNHRLIQKSLLIH